MNIIVVSIIYGNLYSFVIKIKEENKTINNN
jgi:hypothetical protein